MSENYSWIYEQILGIHRNALNLSLLMEKKKFYRFFFFELGEGIDKLKKFYNKPIHNRENIELNKFIKSP